MIRILKRIIGAFQPGEWPAARPHIMAHGPSEGETILSRADAILARFRAARWASIRALEQHIVTPMPRISDFQDPDYVWGGYEIITESGITIALPPDGDV
jgi:hypothetical protein